MKNSNSADSPNGFWIFIKSIFKTLLVHTGCVSDPTYEEVPELEIGHAYLSDRLSKEVTFDKYTVYRSNTRFHSTNGRLVEEQQEEEEGLCDIEELATYDKNNSKDSGSMFSFQTSTLQSDEHHGESYWVSFSERSFHKGRKFKVYSGIFNGKGPKCREHCVVKVFLNSHGTKGMCLKEIRKSIKCNELSCAFRQYTKNHHLFSVKITKMFWARIDEVSTFKHLFFTGERKLHVGEAVIFEEDVRAYGEKIGKVKKLSQFVDMRGKMLARTMTLSTFVHFSYHFTNGELVVCGLEGAVEDTEKLCFLSTPTIHSRSKSYGQGDLGEEGIRMVFDNHVCNDICREMSKPYHTQVSVDVENEVAIDVVKSPPEFCPSQEHPLERMESRMSEVTESMSTYLEPSAPTINDDFDDVSFLPPPPYSPERESRVAVWIINDQARNGFIHSHSTPIRRSDSEFARTTNGNIIDGNDNIVLASENSGSEFSATCTSGFVDGSMDGSPLCTKGNDRRRLSAPSTTSSPYPAPRSEMRLPPHNDNNWHNLEDENSLLRSPPCPISKLPSYEESQLQTQMLPQFANPRSADVRNGNGIEPTSNRGICNHIRYDHDMRNSCMPLASYGNQNRSELPFSVNRFM